jgi:hypothetical protein
MVYTPDGAHMKLGLNFSGTKGGFRVLWAWYDFATRKAFLARFRLGLHIKPRIRWSVERFNVIDNYLMLNDLELVHKEVLEDLNAIEAAVKRTNEPNAYIKP